jgi:hypothetical protein
VTDPLVALIVVWPALLAGVAMPVAEIVATAVLSEVHVTEELMSAVCASVYVPVAVSCVAAVIVGFGGVRAMLCNALTEIFASPVIEPTFAAMGVVPVRTPVATHVPLSLCVNAIAVAILAQGL